MVGAMGFRRIIWTLEINHLLVFVKFIVPKMLIIFLEVNSVKLLFL